MFKDGFKEIGMVYHAYRKQKYLNKALRMVDNSGLLHCELYSLNSDYRDIYTKYSESKERLTQPMG